MADTVLALNAGSSSLKFGLFSPGTGGLPQALARGEIVGLGKAPRFKAIGEAGRSIADEGWSEGQGGLDEAVIARLLAWIDDEFDGVSLQAAGHRIVHGGAEFTAPVRVDAEVLAKVAALTPLAPLHQPLGVLAVRTLLERSPGLAQVCCFDTAFHSSLRPPVSRFAIPRRYEQAGVRRYGFHGLSYEYIAHQLRALDPELAAKRVVVAHLGSGASLCAMLAGKSVDTTMGFSALDGLVMGTRPGALDPGVLLYLQRSDSLSVDALEHLLYRECGLLGVSELSGDLRELVASEDPRAAEALELFAFRASREIAAMVNTLGGIDGLVFTGGIGEHSAEMRAAIAHRLGWLGVRLDEAANQRGDHLVGARAGSVAVLVIPADEEVMIAHRTFRSMAAHPA